MSYLTFLAVIYLRAAGKTREEANQIVNEALSDFSV